MSDKTPAFLLRVPVKSIESWLLADPISLSTFLGISKSLIPLNSDDLASPKATMVNLAKRSRNRGGRAMVAQQGLSVQDGPEHTSKPIEFARHHWDPMRAATLSGSLRRCIKALRQLVGL
ncbi:MAG: hypothetical protein VKO44_00655 [Cyanobacteriota bacterium]|nr:hypothetical protein [Cyanobacteriota bacterium]